MDIQLMKFNEKYNKQLQDEQITLKKQLRNK